MTPERFNAICAALPGATYVVQWGGAHVWKVGGKLFAAMWEGPGKNAGITFKPSEASYDILRTLPGLRPAPYLASRGIKWIQRFGDESMNDDDLAEYLKRSHALAIDGLPKRLREETRAGR
jgi:predicted DNA-binding protein (MmcQ/YjbR family)